MTDCLVTELTSRVNYLENEPVETIYFGGGTPSLLKQEALKRLLATINTHYTVAGDVEITLEANPDDLSAEKLKSLRAAGINRLSIGLQTFDNELLQFLNRAHNSRQALDCVTLAKDAGFENISLDLIYAIPGENEARLQNDLKQLTDLDVPHVSIYCLTIEEDTALGNWYKKGKIQPVGEDRSASDFLKIMSHLQHHGYDQYEISNFGRPGYYSRHNGSYWQGKRYLGIGPGAHSYDGLHRRFNISHNLKYMKGIESGEKVYEMDELTDTDRMNEFMLVSLRTQWGIDLDRLKNEFGLDLPEVAGDYLRRIREKGLIVMTSSNLRLTQDGKLLADQVAEDLFQLPAE